MAKSRPLLSFQVRELFQLMDIVWCVPCLAQRLLPPCYLPFLFPFLSFLRDAVPVAQPLEKHCNSPFQLSICAEDSGGIERSICKTNQFCMPPFENCMPILKRVYLCKHKGFFNNLYVILKGTLVIFVLMCRYQYVSG